MFRDRIKEFRRVKASELAPSPNNWRKHPQHQEDALRAVLTEIGYADAVLARETELGLEVIDGHLRTSLDDEQTVPVLILDVDEEEAKKLLLTHDPIAALAETDADILSELLADVSFDDVAVKEMLDNLLAAGSVSEEDWRDSGIYDLPPVYQVLITCDNEQDQGRLLVELDGRGISVKALTI